MDNTDSNEGIAQVGQCSTQCIGGHIYQVNIGKLLHDDDSQVHNEDDIKCCFDFHFAVADADWDHHVSGKIWTANPRVVVLHFCYF
jgi:hypothetical protein